MTPPTPEELLLDAAGYVPPASYAWTKGVCEKPLRAADIGALTRAVTDGLNARHVVLPDARDLVRRCVVALLSGHLVLQGPPGTGKTTLAALLADAFDAHLTVTTATADWSTYDVIGGLRPDTTGALVAGLGCVSQTVLKCAESIRDETPDGPQAEWLLLDELNRADIDKAVGPLYTVLSSVTARHLRETPLELWFGQGEAASLWVPSRFRIVGTMNDIDTSFVNALSQGLARRFQFINVGVPQQQDGQAEIEEALRQAREWLHDQYGTVLTIAEADALIATLSGLRTRLELLVSRFRRPQSARGWPLGTAQLVDVWRTVLLQDPGGARPAADLDMLLDEAIADRVVPQMGTLDKEQLDAFRALFDGIDPPMAVSSAAVRHLVNPHSPL